MVNKVVGSIDKLWRFPVKSMGGEQLQEVELTERGILGDRAYALIDKDTGKVVSAKSVKLFPSILNCHAAFVEPPRLGSNIPPVQISLPDGTSVRSDSIEVDNVLSSYFKRNVTLEKKAPEDFTIDQYHPDIEDADPEGNRNKVVAQKLGSALFASLGIDSPVSIGAFFDVFPLSVLTTSTLARLSELSPQTVFDERRFRMNIILNTTQLGFIENDWVDHTIGLGDQAQLEVTLLDPRCVMTTLAQADLPQDTDVLRTLIRHNRLQVGNLGLFPCAGVYATVLTSATLRVGDHVTLN